MPEYEFTVIVESDNLHLTELDAWSVLDAVVGLQDVKLPHMAIPANTVECEVGSDTFDDVRCKVLIEY